MGNLFILAALLASVIYFVHRSYLGYRLVKNWRQTIAPITQGLIGFLRQQIVSYQEAQDWRAFTGNLVKRKVRFAFFLSNEQGKHRFASIDRLMRHLLSVKKRWVGNAVWVEVQAEVTGYIYVATQCVMIVLLPDGQLKVVQTKQPVGAAYGRIEEPRLALPLEEVNH